MHMVLVLVLVWCAMFEMNVLSYEEEFMYKQSKLRATVVAATA